VGRVEACMGVGACMGVFEGVYGRVRGVRRRVGGVRCEKVCGIR
jgi:hypothetical protein